MASGWQMPPLLPVPAMRKGSGPRLDRDSDCILGRPLPLVPACRACPCPQCMQTVVPGLSGCSQEPAAGSLPALSASVDKVPGQKGT